MRGYTEPDYGTLESHFAHCYTLRVLDRFAFYWGFITVEQERFLSPIYIAKTGLLDQLIELRPPKGKR